MKTPIAAIVLCAGKGTRMKSERAKVLHPILGRPLCHYPLQRALELGATRIVPVVGHQSEMVAAAVRATLPDAPFTFAIQKEQRGTADAVRSAKEPLKGFQGEVFILYGDVPLVTLATLKALQARKRKLKSPLAFITDCLDDPTGYGRVVRDAEGRVTAIVEQKDATPEQQALDEVNSGLYLVDSDFLWSSLGKVTASNAQKELYLTDLVALCHKSGRLVATVEAQPGEAMGVNDRVELARAAALLQDRINEAHMRNGVSLEDPYTTYIEESVKLAPDVTLAPGCSLQGATKLGRNVVVGQGSILKDALLAEGVRVHPYTIIDSAKVGKNAQLGPWARLRPGTELAEETHIGNFVETKKAKIGKGSKANHLAYLGDCDIGRDVNVGAGTITCNYDGIQKHKTVLGDRVFVGSDSQFVAPVTVGADALIGAGSCIVQDVPAGSLALARGRQVIKRGYTRQKRSA